MQTLISFQWEIFITIEIISIIVLLLFGIVRYGFSKRKLSIVLIITFIILLLFEAFLAFMIYRETGEISSFQIIIGVFIIYACTFGIFDFIKLDRWMRRKIGQWRNVDLLTKRDYAVIRRQKDPKHIAKKYRITSLIHLIVFLLIQTILWYYGTGSFELMYDYLRDFSWIESGRYDDSPYANQASYSIGVIWGIVFIVDFIYSWSYTLFPSK